MLTLAIEGHLLILVKLVLEVSLLIAIHSVTVLPNVTLQVYLNLGVLTVRLGQLALLVTHFLGETLLIALQLLRLLLDDLELGIEHEFLTFHLKALLGQVLEISIEITSHLRILILEEADMLMRGLVVVVHAADA